MIKFRTGYLKLIPFRQFNSFSIQETILPFIFNAVIFFIFLKRTELTPPSASLPKKSASKVVLQKTVFIAIPNSVEFRNYKSNKVYKKAVTLRNVSTSPARFQLAVRPNYSRFTVMIESKGQRGGISPGMHVRLIISFRSDVLDESEETLVINVQHGRSVVIKLRGYRDPPILKVINIPYLRYPQKEWHTMTRNVEWVTELPFQRTNSHEESDDLYTDRSNSASSTSTESVLNCKKLKSFDCGECLVGEQVTLSLMVKNIGGEGRFFIMSEIDWASMHIEDVTTNNMLILPSFAMWPAYFTLKSQEYTYLYIYFSPDTHGMHMETIYAICDNCSVITTEIVGDGVTCKQQ